MTAVTYPSTLGTHLALGSSHRCNSHPGWQWPARGVLLRSYLDSPVSFASIGPDSKI